MVEKGVHITLFDVSIDSLKNISGGLHFVLMLLMFSSKDTDTINDLDIYDTYKDLYLSKKELEEKLLQGIQSANGLKARVGAKKSDGTALRVTTQENAFKKTFDKRFAIPLNFDFFRHPVYPYGLLGKPFY